MRVPVRDEKGAVAIMTALLATILLVMSGFVIDFGMAYVSKRQLQTASDAAALAAVAEYTQYPGTCESLLSNSVARADAQEAADDYRKRNHDESTGSTIEVSCLGTGELQVAYTSTATTPSLFGPLAGADDEITTDRSAAAAIGVGQSTGSGLRPLAMCSAQLPHTIDNQVYRVDFPGDGHKLFPGCPDSESPGSWWTLDCPGERTGSTSAGLVTQIHDGCPDDVSIVPGQEAAVSPGSLSSILTGFCHGEAPQGSEECLSGDPGQLDSGHIEDSWRYLIDTQTTIILPVFCVPPDCVPTTLTGNSTNAVFPVHKLASVVVCGYHFGKSVRYDFFNGACANKGTHSARMDSSKDNYLLLAFKNVQVSGGTRPAGCRLGAGCDGGVRNVRMTE